VIAVNRTGFEPDPSGSSGIEFWGQIFVAAPDGRLILKGPPHREALMHSKR
jgi:N-carbamoylputrescine amidase